MVKGGLNNDKYTSAAYFSKKYGGGLYSKGVSSSEYGICSVRIISLYPVVQPDAGYTTGHPVVQPVALMHNLSRPQLPGCATGWSESYPVVQLDGLKATWLYNRAS